MISIRYLLALILLLGLAGCTASREAAPPESEPFNTPWGAVDIEVNDDTRNDIFSPETVAIIAADLEQLRRERPGERLPYHLLALSGGGAKGAYGAGILTAWSDSGQRPEFDVVTGISTGALMAPAAYLGSDWDDSLKVYQRVSNDDIFTPYAKSAILTRDALNDTSPMKALLKETISDAMIDAVGQRHTTGRRLFIGTTNLDADVFTIWDMGRIANSGRPERYDLFRDILMASASFPVAFPPVYLPATDDDGNTYQQMHVDGGVKETVFLFDYIAEAKELAATLGVNWDEDMDLNVWMLNNGAINREAVYQPVEPRALSILEASVLSLMRGNAAASLYASWTQALSANATVHLTYIPNNVKFGDSLSFERASMMRLYQYGYDRVRNGDAWITQEPAESLEDFREALNIYEVLEPLLPPDDIRP